MFYIYNVKILCETNGSATTLLSWQYEIMHDYDFACLKKFCSRQEIIIYDGVAWCRPLCELEMTKQLARGRFLMYVAGDSLYLHAKSAGPASGEKPE